MKKKILIMGLPGSGKTTLAQALAKKLQAVHFNADAVRQNINKDLGFSISDRLEQATRMGWLCDQVTKSGNYAIADFVCPTAETRQAFGEAYVVWMNTIQQGRFEDTNRLFVPPTNADLIINTMDADAHAQTIVDMIRSNSQAWNNKSRTVMMLGRYQPFHDGHKALFVQALERADQVAICVRDTQGTDEKNPFDFDFVKSKIEEKLVDYAGKYQVLLLPNITNIVYGRDVGYAIEKIELGAEIESISATQERKRMGIA